jgi:hypothetical protein
VPHDELKYVVYARAFGWTPDQVDSLPISIEPWVLPIDAAIETDLANRRAKAQADAEYKAKHSK